MAKAKGFRSAPRPDAEVIVLLEQLLQAARNGVVRSIAIVAVNPIHQVETCAAGDLSDVRTNALIAGLARAANDLMKQEARHG